MRKLWMLLLAFLLIPSMTVSAAEKGSVRIKLDVGELPVINGAFTISRVGMPITDGYRIEEAFGGGFVRREDAQSPHLAQWLSGMKDENSITILLDVDGNAVFSDLSEGLYLLRQTERTDGFYPIQPFLMTIPADGRQNVNVYLEPLPMVADSPPTGQNPTPYIGAIGLVLSVAGMVLIVEGKRRSW